MSQLTLKGTGAAVWTRCGNYVGGQHEAGADPDDKKGEIMVYKKLPCIRVDGNTSEKTLHEVVEEIPFALFINGRHAMTAMMSPLNLEDFVTGYLFTEQIIKGADEIESIKIEKNRISVITKNLFKVFGPKKTILSGCGGSSSFIDAEKLPKIRTGSWL